LPEKPSKTVGSLFTLIQWELEKTFTFPILAIITAVVLSILSTGFGGGFRGSSQMPSLFELQSSFASTLTSGMSTQAAGTFMFSVIIISALTANSLSRDVSIGYMRVLLSYPIGRMKLFFSKILVLLFVPFFFFAFSTLFAPALIYPYLFLSMPSSDVAYLLAVLLCQMLFIFAISMSTSLFIRQPIMAFLASVVTLIGIQQVSSYFAAPLKYLLPTESTKLLMDYYFLPSQFEYQNVPLDVVYPLVGLVIVPVAILIIDIAYFRWRFQT
jgi:ABC-type transport system involved in multi-copper enzyme maturation permease subunit